MKKILLILAVTTLTLGSCKRNGMDSQVRDDEPNGSVGAAQDGTRDSANNLNAADSAQDQRPDSVRQQH